MKIDSNLFLADEFHEWIELNEWQFNPVSFNGVIKYRWVNENYSSQATTKDLYEIFLSQKFEQAGIYSNVMQAEGSDLSEGATVGNGAAGQNVREVLCNCLHGVCMDDNGVEKVCKEKSRG